MTPDEKIEIAKSKSHLGTLVPGIQIKYKAKSLLHRAIGKVLGWVGNKDYADYWTTFGKTTWAPVGTPPFEDADVRTLWHEGQHMQEGFWMPFLYGFPQVLALPAIVLALTVNPWFWLGLLCLAPLPAPFRLYYELKAECVNILMQRAQHLWTHPENFDMSEQLDEFTGPTYYYTCPSKWLVEWLLKRQLYRLMIWDRCTDYEKAAWTFVQLTEAPGE